MVRIRLKTEVVSYVKLKAEVFLNFFVSFLRPHQLLFYFHNSTNFSRGFFSHLLSLQKVETCPCPWSTLPTPTPLSLGQTRGRWSRCCTSSWRRRGRWGGILGRGERRRGVEATLSVRADWSHLDPVELNSKARGEVFLFHPPPSSPPRLTGWEAERGELVGQLPLRHPPPPPPRVSGRPPPLAALGGVGEVGTGERRWAGLLQSLLPSHSGEVAFSTSSTKFQIPVGFTIIPSLLCRRGGRRVGGHESPFYSSTSTSTHLHKHLTSSSSSGHLQKTLSSSSATHIKRNIGNVANNSQVCTIPFSTRNDTICVTLGPLRLLIRIAFACESGWIFGNVSNGPNPSPPPSWELLE